MFNSASDNVIIEVRNVSRTFADPGQAAVLANQDVSLKLYQGQTLGIVGESGCGKSTLARMLTQMDRPDSGEILYQGRDISRLKGEELRQSHCHIQKIFQNPGASLNPKMKIRDIICEPLLNYKRIKRSQVKRKAEELLDMVELGPEFAGRYPHSMSGGQRQRVAIARALALEPEVVICDEATSALDVSVQKNIVRLLAKLQQEKGISIAFICHDIALTRAVSHSIVVMYLGNVVEMITGDKLGAVPMHPYTETLMEAVFSLDMDFDKSIRPDEGETNSRFGSGPGCAFQNRCTHCMQVCRENRPPLLPREPGHEVACHLFDKVR